jgi:hypothetical protein
MGGCGSLRLVANYTNCVSTSGHGFDNIGFSTTFPIGYQLSPSSDFLQCEDNRMATFAMNFPPSAPNPSSNFGAFSLPDTDTPLPSHSRGSPPSTSDVFSDFLPGLFMAYRIWRVAFRFFLPAFAKMPLDQPFVRAGCDEYAGNLIVVVVIAINQIRVVRKTGWLPHYAG